MGDCKHPRLIKVLNMGGEDSTCYKCQECKALLTVSIKPYRITVSSGTAALDKDLQVTHAEACRIGRKFQDELTQATERITALEAALRWALKHVRRDAHNYYRDGTEIHVCIGCGSRSDFSAAEIEHKNGCELVSARALLAPTVPPAAIETVPCSVCGNVGIRKIEICDYCHLIVKPAPPAEKEKP